MTLSDLLRSASVVVPLDAPDRDAAIVALVEALDLRGAPLERGELRAGVLAREAAGSTGIGHGVAIPHARSAKINSPLLAAARLAAPLDFKSADGLPVSLVFLLAVPAADPKSHLKVLAALSRMTSDKKLLSRLNAAKTAPEFHALVAGLPV